MPRIRPATPDAGWHDALRVAVGACDLFSLEDEQAMRLGAETVIQTLVRAMRQRGIAATLPPDIQAGRVGTA